MAADVNFTKVKTWLLKQKDQRKTPFNKMTQ